TDERDIVERECNHAPFEREWQPGDPDENAHEQARYGAHLRPHQHVLAELGRGRGAAIDQNAPGYMVVEGFDLSPDIFDLEQSQYDVDECNHPETERGVDAAGDLLRCAQQPRDVEMLGPQSSDRDAVTVEPRHH